MNRLFTILVMPLALATSLVSAMPEAPSNSSSTPVIFWGHYMPMVPLGHVLAHPHTGGNHDAWPFSTQYADRLDEYKQDIRQALESGVNGFQMLAVPAEKMYEAARQIRKETGQAFFVAPLWLDPRDVRQTADIVEKFQHGHADDPLLYRINGEPLHFVWNTGTDGQVRDLSQELNRRGLHITLAPTLMGTKKLQELADTPDWPNTSVWKAGVSWAHAAPEPEIARHLKEKLAGTSHDFLYLPAIAAGYDSSNRPGQAIHTPFNGVKTLLQSLKIWIGQGFRQITLITWNDPHESLEVPSSRNIWGHNLILKYFRGIAENGKSPLAEPQAVVSYPAELLRGDRLSFQVVGLPPADLKTEWRAEVAYLPIGAKKGAKPFVSHGGAAAGANEEALIEMFWDASGSRGNIPAVQPVVNVEYRADGKAEWKTLFSGKKLPPIRLAYNLVQFPVPYAIDLAKIAEAPSFRLRVKGNPSQPLAHAKLSIDGKAGEFQRVMLCEQSRSIGAFREPGPDNSVRYSNIYARIEASEDIPLTLSVSHGAIADFYSPHRQLEKAILPVAQSSVTFAARPPCGEYRTRVARLNLGEDSTVSLTLASDPNLGLSNLSLAALKNGTTKRVTANGRSVTIGIILTSDATEPLVDYPLPGTMAERDLPLNYEHQAPRLLFAMGLLKNDKVVLSQPVWYGYPKSEPSVPVQWIETRGVFDSFVNPSSEVTLNPFTKEDIRTGILPKSQIPFFYLGFEEGAGSRLNDIGTSQQAGRAFVAPRQLNRDECFENESDGRFQWIQAGYKGHALQLGSETVIRFRSKSAPVGAETVGLWVDVSGHAERAHPVWSTLQAGDFTLSLNDNRTATVKFSKGGVNFESCFSLELAEGWNHLAFVYDLSAVRLYHNGREAMAGEVSKPAYQRTHQTPAVGFASAAKNGPGFTGAVDELQVIGTAIGAKEAASLSQGQVWR